MPRTLYSLLLRGLLPFAALWFKARGVRHAAYRGSLRQRLGWNLPALPGNPLWLHAASVGELRALVALLPALPPSDTQVLVTVGTPTGLARARELFAGQSRVHCWPVPWDLPGAVRRFLDAAQPQAAVFAETELWPNLIAAARTRGMPLTLLSARLTERSLRRYRRWAPALMRETVRAFGSIGAQSEPDRQRFIGLGADAVSVHVTGNLKFDMPQDPQLPGRAAALRARWSAQAPMWAAGSTHAGEEDMVLEAQRRLTDARRSRGQPPPVLALAPRRPERFGAVARWLTAQGLRVARMSAAASHDGERHGAASPDVILIDVMGMLNDWYGAADVAFVGGSLVPVGGHNLLEPAQLGRPVLTGPHTFHAPDVARHLVDAGGARVVQDAADLAASLEQWFGEAGAAAGARAAAVVAAHRGAAGRSVALLKERAAGPASAPSASD